MGTFISPLEHLRTFEPSLVGYLGTFMTPLGPPTPPWGHLGTLISSFGPCCPLRPAPAVPDTSQVRPHMSPAAINIAACPQVCPEVTLMSLKSPQVFPKYPEISLMSLSILHLSPRCPQEPSYVCRCHQDPQACPKMSPRRVSDVLAICQESPNVSQKPPVCPKCVPMSPGVPRCLPDVPKHTQGITGMSQISLSVPASVSRCPTGVLNVPRNLQVCLRCPQVCH